MENNSEKQVVLALSISYNGEPFCGFAKQPSQLTVQGSLEEALAMVFRYPIETVCSGRTDSGVHARGQVVSFTLPESKWRERSGYKVCRSLNALTHDSISIKSIEEKPSDFSARFSAVSREYKYFISTDAHAPLLMQDFSWHLGKELDIDAMNKAAQYLIGEHDFKSFCLTISAIGKPTHRFVQTLKIEPYEIWGEHLICITIVGNAFLHSMVRTIVGTLVAVGLGKRKPEWVKEVLDAKSRSAAGENAPAQGLVFWQVNYEGKRLYDPNNVFVAADEVEDTSVNSKPVKSASKKSKKKKSKCNKRALGDLFGDYLPHDDKEAEFVIPRGTDFTALESLNSPKEVASALDEAPDMISAAPNKVNISSLPTVDPAADTGKLPLTVSAWSTGKLEPVTQVRLQDLEDHSATTVDSAQANKQAMQALENLMKLQGTQSDKQGNRTYPFQRK